jgi:hypothetical protein
MNTRPLFLAGLTSLLFPAALLAAASEVKLSRSADRVRVEIGGQLFTEYIFKDAPKPYLYPVLAVDGTELMRHYPMKRDVPGEVADHPHHRSLWFTHGNVNGVDFWAEGSPRVGKIVSESVEAAAKGNLGTITARNKWIGPDGTLHLSDQTIIRFRGTPEARMIDFEVTLHAPAEKPVVFGDTKEGSMAIRLPLWMTPPHMSSVNKKRVKHEGTGRIINAEGVTNDAAWGKRSTWVDYYAPKDGKVYGVAIFDHPSNPRHPTWWHVRSYALFAANPFGQHDFENLKQQPKAGDFTIAAGSSATFRWRFYFHNGDEKAARIAERYREYAAGK